MQQNQSKRALLKKHKGPLPSASKTLTSPTQLIPASCITLANTTYIKSNVTAKIIVSWVNELLRLDKKNNVDGNINQTKTIKGINELAGGFQACLIIDSLTSFDSSVSIIKLRSIKVGIKLTPSEHLSNWTTFQSSLHKLNIKKKLDVTRLAGGMVTDLYDLWKWLFVLYGMRDGWIDVDGDGGVYDAVGRKGMCGGCVCVKKKKVDKDADADESNSSAVNHKERVKEKDSKIKVHNQEFVEDLIEDNGIGDEFVNEVSVTQPTKRRTNNSNTSKTNAVAESAQVKRVKKQISIPTQDVTQRVNVKSSPTSKIKKIKSKQSSHKPEKPRKISMADVEDEYDGHVDVDFDTHYDEENDEIVEREVVREKDIKNRSDEDGERRRTNQVQIQQRQKQPKQRQSSFITNIIPPRKNTHIEIDPKFNQLNDLLFRHPPIPKHSQYYKDMSAIKGIDDVLFLLSGDAYDFLDGVGTSNNIHDYDYSYEYDYRDEYEYEGETGRIKINSSKINSYYYGRHGKLIQGYVSKLSRLGWSGGCGFLDDEDKSGDTSDKLGAGNCNGNVAKRIVGEIVKPGWGGKGVQYDKMTYVGSDNGSDGGGGGGGKGYVDSEDGDYEEQEIKMRIESEMQRKQFMFNQQQQQQMQYQQYQQFHYQQMQQQQFNHNHQYNQPPMQMMMHHNNHNHNNNPHYPPIYPTHANAHSNQMNVNSQFTDYKHDFKPPLQSQLHHSHSNDGNAQMQVDENVAVDKPAFKNTGSSDMETKQLMKSLKRLDDDLTSKNSRHHKRRDDGRSVNDSFDSEGSLYSNGDKVLPKVTKQQGYANDVADVQFNARQQVRKGGEAKQQPHRPHKNDGKVKVKTGYSNLYKR